MGLPEKSSQSSRPLSIRAFAEAAGTSPRRIRRLIRQGRLRTVENQAGEVRIPEAEVERLQADKQSRELMQSMEMDAVPSTAITLRDDDFDDEEMNGLVVTLARHEAAMVRLGFLESELAVTRKLLKETSEREEENKKRAEEAEQDAIASTVRAVEAEHRLEELRTQVIDSTFRAIELQDEVKKLQDVLMMPWWRRMFVNLKDTFKKDEE